PLLGHVQFAVEERAPLTTRVGEEHADLAVLDAPGRAAVLPLYPDRLRALLEKAGLIDDQHRVLLPELLHHVRPQLIAYLVGIPVGPGQQMLHPIRRRLTRELRELPAALALEGAQQSPHVRQRAAPR